MSAPVAFAARPASEMEWEDLLVRYEIGPRALRIALDDAQGVAGEARTRVCDLLRALVFNELWTADLFRSMHEGGRPAHGSPRIEQLPDDPRALYDRYAALRGRNFAAVQRRGLEVWAWQAEAHPHGTVTAHQLIHAATALDGETLAGVREAARGAGV
ncbi:MAG TPA: hypothetical protein VFJ16_22510 [Longimicrobium sp.]|nr:hypothetical protein [Longimicrobium sp.]